MNYVEMAREMMVTLMGEDYEARDPEAYKVGVSIIAAKLQELLLVPEDLEAAVLDVFVRFPTEKLNVDFDGGNLITALISAVAPLLAKLKAENAKLAKAAITPEVPEDLEAAVRGCFLNLCGQVLYDPDGNLLINESPENESLRDIAIQSLVSAVALLLAERDKRIAELEAEKNRDEELHAFLNKPRHPRRHP